MHYLNEKQISAITSKIEEAEISYSHLFDDLLDHVCCDIESRMQEGLNYKDAYKKVFNTIGLNGLQEIQEATIFYVKFNLLVMKKAMKISAIIGCAILLFGFIFKMMHWPGGGWLYFLGFISLFLGFFPIALLSLKKELKLNIISREFSIYLIGAITIIQNGAAMLFTMMHWPGGKIMVLISWALLFLLFFPMLFVKIIKSKKNKIVNLSLAIFSAVFLGALAVANFNSKHHGSIITEYVEYSEDVNFYKKRLSSLVPAQSNNSEYILLQQHLDKLEEFIFDYQQQILADKKDISEVALDYLHKPMSTPKSDNFSGGIDLLHNYRNHALEMTSDDDLKRLIRDKLTVGPKEYGRFGTESFIKRNFYGRRGEIDDYTGLERILKNAYMVHYEILRDMEKNINPHSSSNFIKMNVNAGNPDIAEPNFE